MAKGELDRLLNERGFLRPEAGYRKFVRRFAIYLLAGVLATSLLALLIAGSAKLRGRPGKGGGRDAAGGTPSKKTEEAEARVLDLSRVASKDFSKFLVVNASIEGPGGAEASEGSDIGGRIYIVKGEENLTDEQACGIESILRLFPDKNIYVIDFNKREDQKYDRCSAKPNYLGLLLLLYRERLQLVLVDRKEFFRDSPLRDAARRTNETRFLAMLLTAHRFGGFVASPDVVITDRYFVQCPPDRTLVEPFAVIAPARNDSYLGYLIDSLAECGPANASLDEVISRSLDAYNDAKVRPAERAPRRLLRTEVCATVKSPCPFLRLDGFGDDSRWMLGLSPYCKQVVQACLGLRVNRMEVEDETSKIRERIRSQKTVCDARRADR